MRNYTTAWALMVVLLVWEHVPAQGRPGSIARIPIYKNGKIVRWAKVRIPKSQAGISAPRNKSKSKNPAKGQLIHYKH
jgi:hypothetical protein